MKKLLMIVAMVVSSAVLMASDIFDPNTIGEFRLRKGIPNALAKLNAGGDVRVCYLGGSITVAKHGWRPQSMKWLKEKFTKANVIEMNAAISGTGAAYGATRFNTDVLSKGVPDLLFIEFRVNGGNTAEMEGIVRQMWKANPNADICFVYTIHQWMANNEIRKNKQPQSGVCFEKVANYYAIPSIDFAPEVIRQLDSGKFSFKVPEEGKIVFAKDGVHPGVEGHELYVKTLVKAFDMMANATPFTHELGKPLSEKPWEVAQLVPASELLKGCTDWVDVDKKNDSIYRSDFGRTDAMLRGAKFTEKEGTSFTVQWEGSDLQFSDIPQDEEMIVEVTVDDDKPLRIKRQRSKEKRLHSRFWRISKPSGKHKATIKIVKLPKGQKFFCGQLQVLGKYIGK